MKSKAFMIMLTSTAALAFLIIFIVFNTGALNA